MFSRNRKNYDDVVGKCFNELTILSYTEPLKKNGSKRNCSCLCSCGKKKVLPLHKVLRGEIMSCGHLRRDSGLIHKKNFDQQKAYDVRTSKDVPIATNKTTGIRNISWSEREQKYVISLKRHGKYFKGRASTLEEALKVKDKLIKEAETCFGEKIYKGGNK